TQAASGECRVVGAGTTRGRFTGKLRRLLKLAAGDRAGRTHRAYSTDTAKARHAADGEDHRELRLQLRNWGSEAADPGALILELHRAGREPRAARALWRW